MVESCCIGALGSCSPCVALLLGSPVGLVVDPGERGVLLGACFVFVLLDFGDSSESSISGGPSGSGTESSGSRDGWVSSCPRWWDDSLLGCLVFPWEDETAWEEPNVPGAFRWILILRLREGG